MCLFACANKALFIGGSLDTHRLLTWFQNALAPYNNNAHHQQQQVRVDDLHQSWRDGRALCALLRVYRPHVVTARDLDAYLRLDDDTDANAAAAARVQTALTLIEQEFGVEPMLSADDIAQRRGGGGGGGGGSVDKLAMLSYLAQIHEAIENEPPKKGAICASSTSTCTSTL